MCAIKQVTDQKANGAHFTPYELARFVARRIIKTLSLDTMNTLSVLDPACGDGELLLAFAKTLPEEALHKTNMIGVETNIQAVKTAQIRLADTKVKQITVQHADFLDICENVVTQHQLFFDIPKQYSHIRPVSTSFS